METCRQTVRDIEVKGKFVLMRSGLDVPLDPKLDLLDQKRVKDDTRIRDILPTLEYLIVNKAKIILAAGWCGRPKGIDPNYSMAPVAKRLELLLKERNALIHPVLIAPDCFKDKKPKSVDEYINGILLGARQSIPKDLKEVFNRTSTTHILAISGYNITVIADAVLAGLVFCMRRRYAFWVSVVVIILFTLLTGASASVVRAAIMGLLFLFASGYGRLYDAKNSIVLAGAVMIYFNPRVLVFNIGFQLSFLAVLGLLYIYPVLKHLTIKWPDIFELKELALMTVSAQIAVAPLLAHYFRQFSLVSLPANILVLPFVPAVMLLGFLSGLGGLIFLPLGQLIGYVAWALSLYQIKVIQFLAALPLASLSFSFDWLLVALACALLIFAAYKLKNKYETI